MIPSRRAASMTRVPFSTAIGLPSIRTLTMSAITRSLSCHPEQREGSELIAAPRFFASLRMTVNMSLPSYGDQFGRGLRSERAALSADMRLVLIPEMLERAGDRSDLRVAEGADRAACDVAAQAEQEVQILLPAAAVLNASQDLQEPETPFAARGALAAGLMVEELQEIFRGPDHARAFFHHRDPAGPQHGPGLRERVEVHLDIQVLRGQEGGRRAAWDEGLEGLVPAHAAGDLIDHLPEGDAHRHFIIARALHVPAQAEDAGPRALGRTPDRGEPLGAPVHDMRD